MTPIQSSPVALRCLLRELEYIGSSIQITVPMEVFGIQRKCCILVKVLRDFCHMHPICTPCIDAYMM